MNHPNQGRNKVFQFQRLLVLLCLITLCLILLSIFKKDRHNESLEPVKTENLVERPEFDSLSMLVLSRIDSVALKIDQQPITIEPEPTSFSVGFYAEIIRNLNKKADTIQMYRDWQGIGHKLTKDSRMSKESGVDYFYYIDKKTGRKKYCW